MLVPHRTIQRSAWPLAIMACSVCLDNSALVGIDSQAQPTTPLLSLLRLAVVAHPAAAHHRPHSDPKAWDSLVRAVLATRVAAACLIRAQPDHCVSSANHWQAR